MQADRVSVECVDQLAQRNSDYHADRVSVECVDQCSQRVFEPGAECRAVFGAYARTQRDA